MFLLLLNSPRPVVFVLSSRVAVLSTPWQGSLAVQGSGRAVAPLVFSLPGGGPVAISSRFTCTATKVWTSGAEYQTYLIQNRTTTVGGRTWTRPLSSRPEAGSAMRKSASHNNWREFGLV